MKANSNFLFYLIATLLFIITACSPVKVSYLGNDYSASDEVTLFFSPRDIQGDFRVIGKMILTAPEGLKSEKLQRKLEVEARSKGADGVLVEIFDQISHGRRIGVERNWHSSYHEEDHETEDFFTGTYVRASLIRFD